MEEFLSKKSLISKNHLNISAALPQLCSDFSPSVMNRGPGSRRQEQSQDGMKKPQPHLAKQQCSQPGIGEKLSNRKVREGDAWHAMGGGSWIQKRNQEEGRQEAQLEKEQLHLGHSNKAAGQRQAWAEGSVLLCQVRPQQAAPPLMHLKAASTHNMQGEPSGANSAEKNHTCCLRSSGFAWNMVDKHLFKPSWRKG